VRRALLALALLGAPLVGCGGSVPARPNLVLIVLDTARADHFSCHGYGRPTTPHVDALAARGVRFSEARSVAPWTLPAHMSMFSGLLPRDHGATWAAFSEPESAPLRELVAREFAPADPERMLGARLTAAGYQCFGFSPNPWVARSKGFAQGFAAFHELWRDEERAAFAPATPADALEATLSGATARGVAEVLGARDAERPFFLFVNLLDPHFPYEPPEPFRARLGGTSAGVARVLEGGRRTELAMIAGASPFTPDELVPLYDGELATADHFVGALVAALEREGVLDDTLLVVTSDHGELLGEEGLWSHQRSVADELLHVPLIVKLPGDARAGTVIDDPLTSNLDVYATLLAAAGLVPPAGPSRDLFAPSLAPRELHVGEYDSSRAYLRQLAGVNPAFDPAAEPRTLHQLYTSGWRTLCVDHEPRSAVPRTPAAPGDPAAAAARAGELLREWLAARDTSAAVRAGALRDDAAAREGLEDLGYVGDEGDDEAEDGR